MELLWREVKRYSPEVRDRAIRMVVDHSEGSTLLEWAAITSVASKLGMTPETLRHWVRQRRDRYRGPRRDDNRSQGAGAPTRTREH